MKLLSLITGLRTSAVFIHIVLLVIGTDYTLYFPSGVNLISCIQSNYALNNYPPVLMDVIRLHAAKILQTGSSAMGQAILP
jgi:hypothetical protein